MLEGFITLSSVCFLLFGSPGPAPLALAASGATFGVRQSVPFLVGLLAGLVVAIIAAAVGFSALFSAFPKAVFVFQFIGALYILYIAYKIATAPLAPGIDDVLNAPSFIDGFILNLLNPKAYAAFLAIFSQFLLPFKQASMALIGTGIVCFIVAMVVDIIWLACGGVIGPLFKHPVHARVLRLIFAALMLLAVAWTFFASSQ